VAVPRWGAESLLGLGPFRQLGKLSYSLYLWHWPILIIAAEQVGKTSLPVGDNLILVVIAVLLSMATYRMVENPIRHWRLPTRTSVIAGVALVLATVLLLSVTIAAGSASPTHNQVVPAANEQVVLDQVAAATKITRVPESIRNADYGAAYFTGGFHGCSSCQAGFAQVNEQVRALGDTQSHHLMVVYGDSHALMWIPAFDAIATADHWKLVVLAKYSCPANRVTIRPNPAWGVGDTSDTPCDYWHTWATNWINQHEPSLLVFSQTDVYNTPGPTGSPVVAITGPQWKRGLENLLDSFRVPNMRMVLLGTTPVLAQPGPTCLAAHPNNVQQCSSPASAAVPPLVGIDRAAALDAHVDYIDTVPWFCSRVCSPIIGNLEVYDMWGTHVSGPYTRYLQNVLAQALGLPPPHS
jgi:hypothetical protein